MIQFIFKVVTRKTAFEMDWMFQQPLHVFRGHSNFSAVSAVFNDFFNIEYNKVDLRRLELDEQRTSEGFMTYWFIELSQRLAVFCLILNEIILFQVRFGHSLE